MHGIISSDNRHRYLVYKPLDFVTLDCTPKTRGRRVVFFWRSLDFMHIFLIMYGILFVDNAFTNVFDVTILLA